MHRGGVVHSTSCILASKFRVSDKSTALPTSVYANQNYLETQAAGKIIEQDINQTHGVLDISGCFSAEYCRIRDG